MMKWYFNIMFLLFGFQAYDAYSQTSCTVPLSPVLTNVSVLPESGKTVLTWSLSPSTDVVAYIVYTYKKPDFPPIDTIWNPSATNYTLTSTATKYFSVSYAVAAYRYSPVPGEDGCASPVSNVLTTIFCSSEIDTCNNKITVKWNKYYDFPKAVKEYRILVSVNGGPLTEMYKADKNAEEFTISDFITDSQYCLVVKAVLDDGTFSTSNKSCLSTKMQQPPEWINADYATVNSDNKISLSFTVEPASEIKRFSLERKTGASGIFQEIAQPVSVSGIVQYIDNKADNKAINYYRLSAINSCNIPATVSNISSTILLSLETSGNDILLSWNSYKKWLGMVSSYSIFINTGKGYQEREVLTGADTVYKLDYKDIMYEVSEDEVCFYIMASETSNPHGITGHSSSTSVCTEPTEIITVPNVFTPDNDLINDFFRPVLSFTPLEYHLVISDRKGIIMFETRDFKAEWDGTQKGNSQAQDVFLWILNVKTPSGKSISKTGTVTIYHNK
jgi:gliding motility-associated-like protein